MDGPPPHAGTPDTVAAIGRVAAAPAILDVVCRTTGMGFAAIAHVTPDAWTACIVQDRIGFGMSAGDTLPVETTICSEIRQHGRPIVFDDVAADPHFCNHRTPSLYNFRSFIGVPIVLPDGCFFGNLLAFDPEPRRVNTPETLSTFTLFAELIAFHIDANNRVAHSEASLNREREVAELREQFIAILGHDLRNPLAAVSAGTRLLLRHPERTSEIAAHMHQSISRMAGLLDNIMDFAHGRLGGGLPMRRDATKNVLPVLENVVQELQSTHPEQIIELTACVHEPVDADAARIGQMLSNLLAHALAHGPAGRPVHVSARMEGGTFRLSVAREGPEIPADQRQALFEPFTAGNGREGTGMGLGLYIASQIAGAHGGTLHVASSHARTEFIFEMPAGASAAA